MTIGNDGRIASAMSDVICAVEGHVGRIRLNRPRAIHALHTEMCESMIDALLAWRADPAVEAVMIDHLGDRGFCAGGDVRAAAASGAADGVDARRFFATEYRLNHLLFTYAKPLLVFMDGITMGGGVGLALPCNYRVATENTLFAMPETAIGLFPDVGTGWYLSRLPGRVGVFLALTGARLDAAECFHLGLATHHLPAACLEDVKKALLLHPRAAATILGEARTDPGEARIAGNRERIDRLFAADRLEDILAALTIDDSKWARKELDTLRARSPQACKVALRLLRQGASMADFADEMRLEYTVAAHVCQRPDFIEGVRALLVDRDNSPRWNPATPEEVTETLLDHIFAPLSGDEIWTPVGG